MNDDLRPDAQHAGPRMHPETRVMILRSIGVGVGFLLSLPLFIILFGMV